MRLTTRYIGACVIILMTLITYEVYIYADTARDMFKSAVKQGKDYYNANEIVSVSRKASDKVSSLTYGLIQSDGHRKHVLHSRIKGATRTRVGNSSLIQIYPKSPIKLLSESTSLESDKVLLTAEEFRTIPKAKTGNSLIDDYGQNDQMRNGESGRGVTFFGPEKRKVANFIEKFHLNVYASDLIPLNRMVPDSRPNG
jgi:hypothetical protein